MEISRNSMIYKSFLFSQKFVPFHDKYFSMPDDLCAFMRNYFWQLFCFSFSIYFIFSALLGIPLIFLDIVDISVVLAGPALFAIMCGIVIGILSVSICITYPIIKFLEMIFNYKESSNTLAMVSEYAKSKIKSYCARIEYKE